jgi:hypothetical protein
MAGRGRVVTQQAVRGRLLDAVIAVALVVAVVAPVAAIQGHGLESATFWVAFVISLAIFAAVARIVERRSKKARADPLAEATPDG